MPAEILKITGKGKPCFCEGVEIKFAKKYTNNAATKELQKTKRKPMSYKIYNEAIKEKPIIDCVLLAQTQNKSNQFQFFSFGLIDTIFQFMRLFLSFS